VTIGAGACVLGPIRVGDRAVVAANAVVLHDVPPDSLVAGVPARVIRSLRPAAPAGPSSTHAHNHTSPRDVRIATAEKPANTSTSNSRCDDPVGLTQGDL
jgi:serine acetyltransferase